MQCKTVSASYWHCAEETKRLLTGPEGCCLCSGGAKRAAEGCDSTDLHYTCVFKRGEPMFRCQGQALEETPTVEAAPSALSSCSEEKRDRQRQIGGRQVGIR